MCLPLATAKLSGDFVMIRTKATVCRNRSDENIYLLRNRTAALIRGKDNFEYFPVEIWYKQDLRKEKINKTDWQKPEQRMKI